MMGKMGDNFVSGKAVSAETVETAYLEAEGVRFAYRTFGAQSDEPLVFCHRFRGTMDD